eukprot:7461962-Pyramimonas_sp.AAC.1
MGAFFNKVLLSLKTQPLDPSYFISAGDGEREQVSERLGLPLNIAFGMKESKSSKESHECKAEHK